MKKNDGCRTVIVHHHIFKNAGTSFNYALRQAFNEDFVEYDLPESRVIGYDQLKDYIQKHNTISAVSGHHIALPTPQSIHFRTLSSVILRDPLARIKSIYNKLRVCVISHFVPCCYLCFNYFPL